MREEFHHALADLIAEWTEDEHTTPERMIADLKETVKLLEREQRQ